MVSAPRMTFPAFIFSPPSTIRKVLDGLDDEIDHRADGLEDRAERNHKQRLLSVSTHRAVRQSFHGAMSDRRAFPQSPLRTPKGFSALSAISTLAGTVTLFTPVRALNALAPMVFTPEDRTIFLIWLAYLLHGAESASA